MTNQPFLKYRWLALAMSAALSFSAAACSAGSTDRADTKSAAGGVTVTAPDQAPSSDSTSPSPSSDAKRSNTTTTADGSSSPGTTPGKVIATTPGQQPADPNDDTPVPLRLDVRSAKRLAGEVVEVRFTITNTSDTATLEPYSDFAESGAAVDYSVSGAALVDLPNDKRYLALLDSEDTCLCTDLNNRSIQPGDTSAMYVQFPAPANDVTTVGFTLPGFDPISELEIS